MTYDENYRAFKAYYPIKTRKEKEFSEIEVFVQYAKGGINYFNGQISPRGYKLSLAPVARGNGFMRRTLLGNGWESGRRFHIATTERFNKKTLERIATQIPTEKMAELYEQEAYQEIQKRLETVSTT